MTLKLKLKNMNSIKPYKGLNIVLTLTGICLIVISIATFNLIA